MSRSFSSWRVLAEGERFIHDYTDNPAVLNKGYALQVQFRDHEKCNCSRSQPLTLYRPHDPSTGAWPNHYLETEACVAQLFADSPTLKAADGCGSASYGWIEYGHNHGFSLCIMHGFFDWGDMADKKIAEKKMADTKMAASDVRTYGSDQFTGASASIRAGAVSAHAEAASAHQGAAEFFGGEE